MSGTLSRFIGGLIGTDTTTQPPATGRDQSSRLFECPACETVYVATDPGTCSACHVELESVPTEHELQTRADDDR